MNTEELQPYKKKTSPEAIHLYQQKVSFILYAVIITRPDAAKTASKLSKFMQNSSFHHHVAAD